MRRTKKPLRLTNNPERVAVAGAGSGFFGFPRPLQNGPEGGVIGRWLGVMTSGVKIGD